MNMKQSSNIGIGLLLAGAAAGWVSAPAQAQRLIRPEALRLSDKQVEQLKLRVGDTPEQHYPAAAKRDAVDGLVVVDLLLNIEGQVLEAQVVAESPRGFGFGLAALDTAKTFEFDNPFKRQVLLAWQVAFLP
jgi:TonB family protein